MTRAVSIHELYVKKRNLIHLQDVWRELFGVFERKGSTIIWGQSGSGKTTFLCYLAKELAAQRERILWNDLEEGDSHSLKMVFKRTKMEEAKGKIILLDRMPLQEIHTKLDRPKSPNIIIINSLQHAMINKREYLELTRRYDNKKFIWLSHAEGKEPEGRLAKFVRYDSNEKIWIEGGVAFSASRTEDTKPLAFIPDMAAKYHSLNYDQFNHLPIK